MNTNVAFLIAELTQIGYVLSVTDEDIELTIDSRLYSDDVVQYIKNCLSRYHFKFNDDVKSIGEYEYYFKCKYFDGDEKSLNIFVLSV